MATTTKLRLTTRALVSTATFILLSAASSAEEARRCYWCGPLAEQVHRSRRAPPCDAIEDNVTACESGLTHCAIVASSPPHIESRFCVKLYQDECYPLYCNSTKTWKMTCPCRGDLCNGANRERENEAFAILDKLVAKTYSTRVKRTAVPSPHVIKDNDNNQIMNNYTKIEDEKSNTDVDEDMLSDQPMEEIKENVIRTDDVVPEVDKNTQEDNENTQDNKNTQEDNKHTQEDDKNAQEGNKNTQEDSGHTPQDIETDKLVADNSDKTKKENNSDKPLEATREPKNMAMSTQESATETSIKTSIVSKNNVESVTVKNIKASMEPPTAEALQQSVTPVVLEKTTEQTTIHITDTTHLTTQENVVEFTPEPSVPGKNDAIRICRHIFMVINWLIVHKLMQW